LLLIDFGVSKKLSADGETDTVIGTTEMMAPEMGLGMYNKTIDWWAVGILLYELLFGLSPFRIK